MGAAANLIGQSFGLLFVLCRKGSSERGAALWLCRCACGKEIDATTGTLRFFGKDSCGCDSERRQKAKVYVGRTFGRLTIESVEFDERKRARFICRCSCGVRKTIRASRVLAGSVLSCGCLRRGDLIGNLGARTWGVGGEDQLLVEQR